jgi:hypothetical protein
MSDPTGHFLLVLSQKLTTATAAVIDPQSRFAPVVVPLRLSGGIATNLALPVLDAQTLANVQLANGVVADSTRGAVLGWAIDASGAPQAAVSVAGNGALVDGAGPNQLSSGNRTGAGGAVAFFDVPPTMLTVQLAPPTTAALRGDSYVVPVRAGALTATTLVLAPR